MEHRYESNIKCPYCNWEDTDSWEFDADSGTHTCGSCDKDFNVEREIEVTYSTKRISCEEIENKHDYQFERVFESKRKYEKDVWIDLPKSEFTYTRIIKCSICGHEEYISITKNEYTENLKIKEEAIQRIKKRLE